MDRRAPLAVSPRRLRPRPHRAPRPPLVPSPSVKTPPGSIKKAAPMRASICAIPSPVRHQPSPIRASVSALSSPVRLDLVSPMLRASISALPSAARLDLSPPRAKLDLPAAAPLPAAAWATGKENIPAASPQARPSGKEGHYDATDRDERVALDLAALARVASPVAGPLFVRGRLYDLYSARRDERLKHKHGFPYGGEWASPEAMAEDPIVAVELSKRRVAKKASNYSNGAESVRRSMPASDFAAGRYSALGTRSSLRSSKEMKKPSVASGAVSMAVKERRVNSRTSARRT